MKEDRSLPVPFKAPFSKEEPTVEVVRERRRDRGFFQFVRMAGKTVITKSWAELNEFFERMETIGSGGRVSKTRTQEQINEYRSWVFDATSAIYKRVMSVPYHFYHSETGQVVTPENPGWPVFSKPFLTPNPYMSFRFLKAWWQLQWDLTGKAFGFKGRNALGVVEEVWPIDVRDLRKIIVAPMGTGKKSVATKLVGFEFQVSQGGTVQLSIKDVLYFKYPHPENPHWGFSPIQALAYVTDLDYYIEAHQRAFFKNQARPDVIIQVEGELESQAEADQIKERWITRFGGVDSVGSPAVLDSGMKVDILQSVNKDLEFLNLTKFTKDHVLAAYSVPEGVLGLVKDVNRANAEGIERTFNKYSIRPRLILMDEILTRNLCHEFDERLEFKHDNPVAVDEKQETEKIKARTAGMPIWTINEARKVDGLDPIEGGDMIFAPLNFAPVGQAPTPQTGPAPPLAMMTQDGETVFLYPLRKEHELIRLGENEEDKKKKTIDIAGAEALTNAIYRQFARRQTKLELLWEDPLEKLFTEQREIIVKNIREKYRQTKSIEELEKVWNRLEAKFSGWSQTKLKEFVADNPDFVKGEVGNGDLALTFLWALYHGESWKEIAKESERQARRTVDKLMFDKEEQVEKFTEVGAQIHLAIMRKAGDDRLDDLGREYIKLMEQGIVTKLPEDIDLGVMIDFDIYDPAVEEYIGLKSRDFGKDVVGTNWDHTRATLIEGVQAGESPSQLMLRLNTVFDPVGGISEDRKWKIARTETISSHNTANYLADHQSGVVEEKTWLTAIDERERRDHRLANKQTKELLDYFIVGGEKLLFPGALGGSAKQVVR